MIQSDESRERDSLRLERCLRSGGVAIVPTDTVYGLACDPESERAIARLYELKGRPASKPAAVMFFALEPALDALGELGPRIRKALGALLPGPVTLLLANPGGLFARACDPSGGGSDRAHILGLRVPKLSGATAELTSVKVAMLQSSANLSGGPDPCRLSDVPSALRDGADLVIDGGELTGTASTVIDLSEYERSGAWRIVREGPFDAVAVAAALG